MQEIIMNQLKTMVKDDVLVHSFKEYPGAFERDLNSRFFKEYSVRRF